MPVKPSSTEEEFFAREDAEKKRKLALERAKEVAEQQKAELKQLHWMRCPKCGFELNTVSFKGVEIDKCFQCGVTVFDAGELEKIGVKEKEGSVVKALVRVFNK